MENNENQKKDEAKKSKPPCIAYPATALALDFASALLFALGALAFESGFLAIFGLLFVLLAIATPVGAIVIGIWSLFIGVKKTGVSGMVMAILAIAIPVIAVITVVLLFSTGAIRISLM